MTAIELKQFLLFIVSEIMTYSWSRIGQAMPSSAEFSDYNRVITIRNVQLSHTGTYRCRVQRQLGGETHGDVTIVIEGMSFCYSAMYFSILLSSGDHVKTYTRKLNGVYFHCLENPGIYLKRLIMGHLCDEDLPNI